MGINQFHFWAISLGFLVFFGKCFGGILTNSLKMAQCRAHCLNQFVDFAESSENKNCQKSQNCLTCWQMCENLALHYPIWSSSCGDKLACSVGCEASCDFLSHRKNEVIPLSSLKSRLTLIFKHSSAHWDLQWFPKTPKQSVVFALFTKSSGTLWKLKLQTSEQNALLKNIKKGTELKLVAIAESGLLSVIITPFEPPSSVDGKGSNSLWDNIYPWNRDNAFSEKLEGWPLSYNTSVKDSGLIAAKIWWFSEPKFKRKYLVTWEVLGGGLKGHLYTDISEVELKLWPNTVYQIQVEILSGYFTSSKVSESLTLDTSNLTSVVYTEKSTEKTVEMAESRMHKAEPVTESFQSGLIVVIVTAVISLIVLISLVCYLIKVSKSSKVTNRDFCLRQISSEYPQSTRDKKIDLYNKNDSLKIHGELGPQNTLGIPKPQNIYSQIHHIRAQTKLPNNIA